MYLEGFEPDFDTKQELRFVGGMPDLHQFDYVFISCSGGKDSHAMAYLLAELATRQNYNKQKMELLYADTGLEWHDTFEQVKRIGLALDIKAVKVLPKYKLLDNVRRRWAKFNGLEWGDERERERERERTPQTERREHGKSIPKSCTTVLYQRPQAVANRILCPFPSNRIMWCRSHGKQFPIQFYVRNRIGGGVE